VRDATLAETQAAGYALPPSQIAPTLPNRVLEGFAGKLTTAQQASAKNQNVTNTLIKREIGLLLKRRCRSTPSVPRAQKPRKPIRRFVGSARFRPTRNTRTRLSDIATKYDRGHGGMASLRNKEVESSAEGCEPA
jgi:hypothetical protein